MGSGNFFTELKRRNVVRVAIAYALLGWVVLQGADFLLDLVGAPDWVVRVFAIAGLVGFPFVLAFAWIYELTPEGLKRERDVQRGDSIAGHTGRRMNLVIVALLVVAIAGMVLQRVLPGRNAAPPVEPGAETVAAQPAAATAVDAVPDNSIAVLPFVNMSGDPDNEYFSDGLTEELLNTLVRLGGLQVTGRTSAFAFKGRNVDLREIGQALNVASVLEGSVRRAGNRVRITAQLIKASDGYHLWSDTFDRELNDIFAIQQEIADRVAESLHVALLGNGAGLPEAAVASDPRAYEEYLRGMYIWQRNPDDLDELNRVRAHLEAAQALDPSYVDPYWGMFLVWDRMNRNGHVAFTESLARMEEYAAKLRSLAPQGDRTLGAAGRLALVNYRYGEAADFLRKAAERYPGSAIVQGEYASILATLKQYGPAIEAIERAFRLDPLSLEVLRWKSFILYRAGDCEGVDEVMQRALEIEPNVGRFRYYLAMCLYETTGALERPLELARAEPLQFAHDTALAILLHRLGDEQAARQQVEAMQTAYGDTAAYQYGQLYAQWGDTDAALDWLETAARIRDPGLLQADDDRLLRPLRDQPRFQQLLRDAGFR